MPSGLLTLPQRWDTCRRNVTRRRPKLEVPSPSLATIAEMKVIACATAQMSDSNEEESRWTAAVVARVSHLLPNMLAGYLTDTHLQLDTWPRTARTVMPAEVVEVVLATTVVLRIIWQRSVISHASRPAATVVKRVTCPRSARSPETLPLSLAATAIKVSTGLCPLTQTTLTLPIVGHFSKDCPEKKDWSRVKCSNCGESTCSGSDRQSEPKLTSNSGPYHQEMHPAAC